jgi:ABC-type transport system substrate-binding protein
MIMSQVWPQASIVDGRGDSTICFAEVPNCPESLFTTAEVVSVNPQTVEYDIDPKARWSDGVPVTAADFIGQWRDVVARATALPITDPIAGYLDIASIDSAHGGSTVTVHFKAPYADWPSLFTNLVPAHVVAKYGFTAGFSAASPGRILSAGPYRISRIVPGHTLILDRNPKFWGTPPSVKRIVFRVMKSERATLAALSSGAVTVAALSPGPLVDATVAASDELAAQPALAPTLWQLAFNVARPTLELAVVRQAIAKIVNRNELIANSIGLDTPYGQTVGNRLFPAGAPGSQGNDGAYGAVDLAGASELLASAGDVTDRDGFVHTPSGGKLTLRLLIPADNATMSSVAKTIQAELLAAGITTVLRSGPLTTLLDHTLPLGAYDLALVPYPVSPYPSTTASLYLDPVGPTPPSSVNITASAPVGASGADVNTSTTTPTTTPTTGGAVSADVVLPAVHGTEPVAAAEGTVTRDVLGYNNAALGSLFGEAASQLNTAADLSLYNEIDSDLWADMPTLPLFQTPITIVTRIALLNVAQSSSSAQFLWNAENWAVEANPTPVTTTSTPASP